MRIHSGIPPAGGGSTGEGSHKVQKGETLETIAGQYGVTAEALAKNNPQLKNPEKLRAGTNLNIPVAAQKESSAAGAASKDSFESSPGKSAIDKMI